MRTSTKYQTQYYSNICVNPNCRDSMPHYVNHGKLSGGKCSSCGRQLRRIQGEPRGTYHPLRR